MDPGIALFRQVGFRHLVAAHIGRIRRGNLQAEIAAESLEFVVPGHEVGLAVHLDHHADLAADVNVALDQAFAGGAVGLLGGGGRAPSCGGW